MKSDLQSEIKDVIKKIPEGIIMDCAIYEGMESLNDFRYKASSEISPYCSIIQSDLIIASGQLRDSTDELEKKFMFNTYWSHVVS